jgi:hypothetical protein
MPVFDPWLPVRNSFELKCQELFIIFLSGQAAKPIFAVSANKIPYKTTPQF